MPASPSLETPFVNRHIPSSLQANLGAAMAMAIPVPLSAGNSKYAFHVSERLGYTGC